jgi:hypothetical protein
LQGICIEKKAYFVAKNRLTFLNITTSKCRTDITGIQHAENEERKKSLVDDYETLFIELCYLHIGIKG